MLELLLKSQASNSGSLNNKIWKGNINMLKNKENLKNIIIIILIILMAGIIFLYQTRKIGFHEDEMYTIASSVNPYNGLMTTYDENNNLKWFSNKDVKDYITLSVDNYLNLKSVYVNQSYDNHPPFFYTLVHFSSILFSGEFTKYNVFVVNIIAFILSCFVIKKILKVLDKEHLTIPTLIFYGLSMGTISMVIFQRMYMLLTFFILLYFYYTLRLYKNEFNLTKELNIKLGVTTVLGFLTQYFFAIYAFFIFVIMIIKMIKDKKYQTIKKYVVFHILYAIIGILLFVPCIRHLLFTDRGIKNLGNSGYFSHLMIYIKHLAYAFTIKNILPTIFTILGLFFIGVVYLYKFGKEKFIVVLSIVPSVFYFFIVVKMTSFQELRYIMPVIPFVCITLFLILDYLLNIKYKNVILTIIAILLVLNGIVFSSPKFLYEDYKEYIDIAENNKEKSFVYIYDNFFNHMQSLPEMMIYNKTLIVNVNNDELKYVIDDEDLNSQESYILCIKSYMDNEQILNEIKEKTDFDNITELHKVDGSSTEMISNNLYLISK